MKIKQNGLGLAHSVLRALDELPGEDAQIRRLRSRLPTLLSEAQGAKNVRPALFARLAELREPERPEGVLRSLWCAVRCAVQNDVVGVAFHARRVLRGTQAPQYLGNLPYVVAAEPWNAEAKAALEKAKADLDSFVNAKVAAAL